MQKIVLLFFFSFATVLVLYGQGTDSWELTPVGVLNTPGDEYAPRVTANGILYSRSPVVGDQDVGLRTELLFSAFRRNGLQEGRSFSEELSSPLHESHATMGPNEDFVVFSRNSPSKRNARNFLYLSKIGVYDFQESNELPFNDPRFNTTHPSLDPSGKRLLFSSDRPGGFGGFDLYYAEFKNGEWSKPINLGEEVNSKSDEIFPYWSDNNQISFSSNRPGGLGGIDLYLLDASENTWKQVKHLGKPFSSKGDDHGLSWSTTRGKGYLASNREGGQGGDDIYSFTFSKESPIPWLASKEPRIDLVILNSEREVIASVDDNSKWYGRLSTFPQREGKTTQQLATQLCGEPAKGQQGAPDSIFMSSIRIETTQADFFAPIENVTLRNPSTTEKYDLKDASGGGCIAFSSKPESWIVEKTGFAPQTIRLDPALPYQRIRLEVNQPTDTIVLHTSFESDQRIFYDLSNEIEKYLASAENISGYQLVNIDLSLLTSHKPKSAREEAERLTEIITKALPVHTSLTIQSKGLSVYSDEGRREQDKVGTSAEARVEFELQLRRIPDKSGIGLNLD